MKLSLPLTRSFRQRLGLGLMLPAAILGAFALPNLFSSAKAQTAGSAMTVSSDIQEANTQTGVVTARGNVRIDYPARQIQATSAQAQYFSKERRIVLTGNVYVLQEGNSMRGETITYLIDEGRFVAQPKPNRQVESTYILADPEAAAPSPASVPGFSPKPALKNPESQPLSTNPPTTR